jgi:hypothetical protein
MTRHGPLCIYMVAVGLPALAAFGRLCNVPATGTWPLHDRPRNSCAHNAGIKLEWGPVARTGEGRRLGGPCLEGVLQIDAPQHFLPAGEQSRQQGATSAENHVCVQRPARVDGLMSSEGSPPHSVDAPAACRTPATVVACGIVGVVNGRREQCAGIR